MAPSLTSYIPSPLVTTSLTWRNPCSLDYPLGPYWSAQSDEEIQACQLGKQQQRGRRRGILVCPVSTLVRHAAHALQLTLPPYRRYSVFTVMSVHVPCRSSDVDPLVIHIMAAIDNRRLHCCASCTPRVHTPSVNRCVFRHEPEDLALAPWA